MTSVTPDSLKRLIRQDLNAKEIAQHVGWSYRQLQLHLQEQSTTLRILRHEVTTEDGYIIRECKVHGRTPFKPLRGKQSQALRCAQCHADRSRLKRQTVRARVVEHLGGKCLRCDYKRCIRALHAHHRDPATKRNTVSRLSSTEQAALDEAAHCDLLCGNCHAIEHAVESPAMLPSLSKPDGHQGPWCSLHGITAGFYKHAQTSFKCKQCEKDRVARHRRQVKLRLLQDLEIEACSACRQHYPAVCMQWHHPSPDDKDFTVSSRGSIRAYDALLAEARKCIAVCSNCHAEAHCPDDHNHDRK